MGSVVTKTLDYFVDTIPIKDISLCFDNMLSLIGTTFSGAATLLKALLTFCKSNLLALIVVGVVILVICGVVYLIKNRKSRLEVKNINTGEVLDDEQTANLAEKFSQSESSEMTADENEKTQFVTGLREKVKDKLKKKDLTIDEQERLLCRYEKKFKCDSCENTCKNSIKIMPCKEKHFVETECVDMIKKDIPSYACNNCKKNVAFSKMKSTTVLEEIEKTLAQDVAKIIRQR